MLLRRTLLLTIIPALILLCPFAAFSHGYYSSYDSVKAKHDTAPVATGNGKTTIDTGKTQSPSAPAAPEGLILKPIIGLGVGIFSYFGNVKNPYGGNLQNPGVSRLAYDIVFAQKLSDHFEFNLYGMEGKLGQYIRSVNFNWNFESQIDGGGVHLVYKFLPKQTISPFVLLGVESFEFLSKTDMRDKSGNEYYYWSDGSIRSLPQNAPNASTATILTPDYTYETDIRSLNLDGSGKYTEQTFAIPIGGGFMIHVNKKADFTIGSTLHYTFTDHIDGLTPSVSGPLKGTHYHDMFLMSYVSLRYDLSSAKKMREHGEEDESRYDGVDFASLLDDTIKTYPTDTAMPSDSAIAKWYRMYTDSTGQYTMTYDSSGYKKPGEYVDLFGKTKPATSATTVEYTVQLGRYSKGVPAEMMDKFLSVPDVKSTAMKDSSSVYTAGDYSDYDVAKKRQQDLINQGITGAQVVYLKGGDYVPTDKAISTPTKGTNGGTVTPDKGTNANPDKGTGVVKGTNTDKGTNPEKGTTTNPDKGTNTGNPPATGGIVYRVQLGAYRHKLTKAIFSGVSNVVEVKTENGFYTYSAGVFTNYNDAAIYKTQLVTQGFSDAFIKAYKDGKRIPLDKAGATYVKPEKENLSDSVSNEQNTLDKKQIRFRVQVGVFKGAPPKEQAEQFKQFSEMATVTDESGLNHYVVGSYTDYESAKAMKDKILAGGVRGAFVVAYFKDKPIAVPEAISILKQ